MYNPPNTKNICKYVLLRYILSLLSFRLFLNTIVKLNYIPGITTIIFIEENINN